METVHIQLQWFVQPQFAGMIAGREQGFYDDECIIAQIRAGDPSIDPIYEARQTKDRNQKDRITSPASRQEVCMVSVFVNAQAPPRASLRDARVE